MILYDGVGWEYYIVKGLVVITIAIHESANRNKEDNDVEDDGE